MVDGIVMIKLNIFAFSGLFVTFITLPLVFINLRYGKNRVAKVWGLFNLAVAIWAMGAFFIGISRTPEQAIWSWRFGHIGVIFIAVFFYHVVYLYCHLKNKNFLIAIYVLGILYLLSDFTNLFISEVYFMFNSLYYTQSRGIIYPSFFMFWCSLIILGEIELYRYFKKFHPISVERYQGVIYFIANVSGFLGGATNFLPMFGINLYPYGNWGIPFYGVLVTYAIVRYGFMDINLILTRTGIFVMVYSFVLGLPLTVAFGYRHSLEMMFHDNWWMIPLIFSSILATTGPFIYLYFQKRAEDRLLQEQRRYQATLRQASLGMGRIKDLNRLVSLIVHIVTRTVRIDHCRIYLREASTKRYKLRAVRSQRPRFNPVEDLDYDSSIVEFLRKTHRPILYEEIRQSTQDYGDPHFARLEVEMKKISAVLVIPCLLDDDMLAIIILGNKMSRKLYSNDDLVVFSILASQAALAIENAQFYDDVRMTHEQLFKAEKMATIGTMADGLSHQINNRLHALGFIAGDALDTIRMKRDLPMSPELKEMLIDIEHALNRIEDNVAQGGEIVQGLLKYTRKGESGFSEIELDKLLNAVMEMAQFKIKPGDMIVLREYGTDLPKIYGNFTQLQEVFFNLIDNAYDAMMQRKAELPAPDYKATIKISARPVDQGGLEIVIEDNGMGIRDEDREKLFTPFFTTKLSSKKGTGLGLYVIQKLIAESHKGKVSYYSRYGEGTKVVLFLNTVGWQPTAKDGA